MGCMFTYRKLLAGFRPVESGESRNGVCSLGSAGKALLCSSSTRLYDLTLEIRLDIKDLKDTKGKFDKEGLIHMFNMVLRGQDNIIVDTDLVLTVGWQRQKADFRQNDLGLTETKDYDSQEYIVIEEAFGY